MQELTYAARAELCSSECAKELFLLMEEKKSNLSFSVDVTKKAEILRLTDLVGPFIVLLKTHIDIVEDFDEDLVIQLNALAKKHKFMIFEDRKFADIGNTVKLQYSSGVYKISEWSDIVNCHIVPGPGIIDGLKEVGLPKKRGLLILAEMSSKGSMAVGEYTHKAVELAKANKDFVIGFISGRSLVSDDPSLIHMTPGVSMSTSGDSLGQQYNDPHRVIYDLKSDIIIVGRGIYKADNPAEEAKKYQFAGWSAYEERL
eukprot:Nk52_evm43s1401 gene=Nk52_evmTU43s1401